MNDGYINGFLHFLCELNDDGSGHSSEYKVWGEAAWNFCQMGLSTIHIAHILPACKIKIKASASCLDKGSTNFALPCFGSAEYLCVWVINNCHVKSTILQTSTVFRYSSSQHASVCVSSCLLYCREWLNTNELAAYPGHGGWLTLPCTLWFVGLLLCSTLQAPGNQGWGRFLHTIIT